MTAVVVPHAPLLVDIPGRPHPLPRCTDALAALDVSPDIVVVTPHAPQAGVYAAATGDLRGFGLDVSVDVEGDEETTEIIATRWERPLLHVPLDHGAVVPLVLLRPRRALVCGLPGWTGQKDGDPAEAIDAAAALGPMLAELDGWSVVVSAHTSAAASARAPLTELAGGRKLHDDVVAALRTDPVSLKGLDAETARSCGACGIAPFTALAALVKEPLDVLYEDAPFGVGYVVATT